MFPESLDKLLEIADELYLDLNKTSLTLDPGFDSKYNKDIVSEANIAPVIKPNLRGLKDRKKRYLILDKFEEVEHIYKERYKIEKCFAWEDTYRKLVIRYERLQSTFMGFRYLAYSMINLRSFFKENIC